MQELNEYGIDFDGPVPELESEQQENLNILDIPNPLSGDDFAELQQQIDPLHQESAHGIDVYLNMFICESKTWHLNDYS